MSRCEIFLLLCFGSALTGCYNVGAVLPAGVKRVFVPIFKNETSPYMRDLEDDLTEELRKKIEIQTDGVIAPDESSADAVLEGTLVSFNESVKAEDRLDKAVYSYATATIRVKFRRTGPGGEVFSETRWTETAHFRTESGIGTAKEDIIRRLTDRILAMITKWD